MEQKMSEHAMFGWGCVLAAFSGAIALGWFVEPESLARMYGLRWAGIVGMVGLIGHLLYRRAERKRG